MKLDDYIALYMNGMSFMFFAYISFRMFMLKNHTRAQKILGGTLALWAFLQLKELIFYFPETQNEYLANLMLSIDGWAVPACSFYLLELTAPGWLTIKRMFLLWFPSFLFTVVYSLIPLPALLVCYWILVSIYSISIIIIITYASKRYNKYVRMNYSYYENMDVSWLKKATVILVICLAIWMYTSIFSSGWGYCIYYLSSIILWGFIAHYSEKQISIPIPNNLEGNLLSTELMEEPDTKTSTDPFETLLQKAMEEQQLYLNPKLTISDVANAIGTNRTYLSNYFNNVLNITFYDYINDFRIEKTSKHLLSIYPRNMTIDEIAERSGFNSTSTFRRAFLKSTGMTPLQYRKKELSF